MPDDADLFVDEATRVAALAITLHLHSALTPLPRPQRPPSTWRDSEVDNALVAQKSAILDAILDDRFDEALLLLRFSARLWAAAGYGYKTRELTERIREVCREREIEATHPATAARWRRLAERVAVPA